MEKIPTIFDRDWRGNRKIISILLHHPDSALPTEKLDGTNVRLTVRSETLVRVEARKNPSKDQKAAGIVDPWYRDAEVITPFDRYIWEAANNTPLTGVPDGEWSAEAIGPKIQGNPLQLEEHRCFFFAREIMPDAVCVPILSDVPDAPISNVALATYFQRMRDYLANARSAINPNVPIEGIVWWTSRGFTGKIKVKDFE